MEITNEERLLASAKDVFKQLNEDSSLGISLDPDLADYVGAFQEDAIGIEDILNDIESGDINE